MNKPRVHIAHPGLGSHVRQAVKAYYEANMLVTFSTTFLLPDNRLINGIAHKIRKIKSKQFDDIPYSLIHKIRIPEIIRLFSSKYFSNKTTDKIWEWSELCFDKWVAKRIDKNTDVFHGYEHACFYSLEKCRSENVFSIYELPSAHHRFVNEQVFLRLINEEPDFKNMNEGFFISELSHKRNERRDKELDLSDCIVCASSYTRDTLLTAGIVKEKIEVLPYGFPQPVQQFKKTNEQIQFIVSGNLSYQKGVHHILRLWKEYPGIFQDHKLILIGNDQLHTKEWDNLPENVYKYKRLPQLDYFSVLKTSDVLISNSYSDGFGMVMSEAMAHGVIVIGTSNSAAPDIIETGKDGFVIETGNPKQLFESMQWIVEHTDRLDAIKSAAVRKADTWQWKDYRQKLSGIVHDRYMKFRTLSRND